ncbi:hypothetical protein GGQ99_004742 [Aminobacter niigataensis]|uniref:Uncharacterized protein n=1 Tax=Aminobacter niigataensis TaxID=83265 RepID=A0ABR6L827_9HYPH|nr:hypothetical protein [Aminobacter niigataensis]MBB4652958.1 hypothetical protein [Aminobacter niigataensis]
MSPAGDPIAKQAQIHHDAIRRNEQRILDMERDRDIALRSLEGELAEAARAFEAEQERILQQIADTRRGADARIATRQILVRSSRDALVALEPNQASLEAPMSARQVPRSEPATVPIQVHRGIKA